MTIYYQKKSDGSIKKSDSCFNLGDLVVVSLPGKCFRIMSVDVSGLKLLDSVVFNKFCPPVNGDTILLHFDPILGRGGNVRLLKWMTSVFSRPEIKAFFEDAVRICTYKESRWDAKVLADLYSISPIQGVNYQITERVSMSTKTFVDYFGVTLRKVYTEMIAEGMDRPSVFKKLKSLYRKDFSSAFKAFKKENPDKTIYET